jgi:hypothetical protein
MYNIVMRRKETTLKVEGARVLKKIILNMILSVNALIWIIFSAINYVGIMLQLKEDIMSIFLWSIFTIMMYGLVVYAISLVITRLYLIYQFRNCKVKYLNRPIFVRQMLLLTVAIAYLYVACYYNAHFLGLLPMFLFFGKKLTNVGKVYLYVDEKLLLIDDTAKEYLVHDIDIKAGKVAIQEINTRNLDILKIQYKMHPEEKKFLEDICINNMDFKEVA